MKMKWLCVVVPVLASCSSTSYVAQGLDKLEGQKVETAFKVLGYPDKQQTIGSDKVYTWSTQYQEAMTVPQVGSTVGYVGDTPAYGISNYTSAAAADMWCKIKIAAGNDGVIKHTEYSGNSGGCQAYSAKLEGYVKGN